MNNELGVSEGFFMCVGEMVGWITSLECKETLGKSIGVDGSGYHIAKREQ